MPLGKYIFKNLGPVACNTPQIDLHTQYNPYQNPGQLLQKSTKWS